MKFPPHTEHIQESGTYVFNFLQAKYKEQSLLSTESLEQRQQSYCLLMWVFLKLVPLHFHATAQNKTFCLE